MMVVVGGKEKACWWVRPGDFLPPLISFLTGLLILTLTSAFLATIRCVLSFFFLFFSFPSIPESLLELESDDESDDDDDPLLELD